MLYSSLLFFPSYLMPSESIWQEIHCFYTEKAFNLCNRFEVEEITVVKFEANVRLSFGTSKVMIVKEEQADCVPSNKRKRKSAIRSKQVISKFTLITPPSRALHSFFAHMMSEKRKETMRKEGHREKEPGIINLSEQPISALQLTSKSCCFLFFSLS